MPKLRHNKLIIFLLPSLALHAAILLLYQTGPHTEMIRIGTPLTLSLLQSPAPDTPKTVHKPATAHKIRRRVTAEKTTHPKVLTQKQARPAHRVHIAKKVSSSTTPPVRKVEPVTPSMAFAQPVKPAAGPSSRNHESLARVQQRIQQKLHARLAFYHYYPMIAIRNQWQGRVNLGLRIEANGQLSNVHVIHSSGYSILDNAAMKSVHRVAALPEARNWLEGQHLDMVIPVVYRLVDG